MRKLIGILLSAIMVFVVFTPAVSGAPERAQNALSGDINGDGKLNARDVIALMKRIISGTPGENAEKTLVVSAHGRNVDVKDHGQKCR